MAKAKKQAQKKIKSASTKEAPKKGFFAGLWDKLDEKVAKESRKECCCKGKCK